MLTKDQVRLSYLVAVLPSDGELLMKIRVNSMQTHLTSLLLWLKSKQAVDLVQPPEAGSSSSPLLASIEVAQFRLSI